MSEKDNLTLKEQGAVVIEAGLNAIPVVGGSLATLYFGAKQEKQFKRLERFYSELQKRVEKAENIDISKVDQAALASIIEEINEAVEANFTENRISYFQNCFLNSLKEGGEVDHDKKRYFISKLLRLSDMDIEILVALYKAPEGHVMAYAQQDEDQAADFNAALERLKSDGFLNSRLNGMLKGGIEWGEVTAFYLSGFGRDFVEYCLATTHNNQVQLTDIRGTMYKSKSELEALGPVGQLNYVRSSFETWKKKPVDKIVLNKTIDYLEKTNSNIEKNWLSTDNASAYQQTFDKNKKYIEALKLIISGKGLDANLARKYMNEIEEKVIGLSKNWEDSPLDQCIPPVLEHCLYMRSAFEKAAGY